MANANIKPGTYRTRSGLTVEVWSIGRNATREECYMGPVPGLGYMFFGAEGHAKSGDTSLDLIERADPMDEVYDAESLVAELISQRGPRNTEPGC